MKVDLTAITPYGDTLGDGIMQLSFTLPVALSASAAQRSGRASLSPALASKILLWRMRKQSVDQFSFFVIMQVAAKR